jgi:proteic killer suppression protein
MAILSFRCNQTRALFESLPNRFHNIRSLAERKLQMLDAANELRDVGSSAGSCLEQLAGNRSGQYGIRINDQWRVCFVWVAGGVEGVEIVGYQ